MRGSLPMLCGFPWLVFAPHLRAHADPTACAFNSGGPKFWGNWLWPRGVVFVCVGGWVRERERVQCGLGLETCLAGSFVGSWGHSNVGRNTKVAEPARRRDHFRSAPGEVLPALWPLKPALDRRAPWMPWVSVWGEGTAAVWCSSVFFLQPLQTECLLYSGRQGRGPPD